MKPNKYTFQGTVREMGEGSLDIPYSPKVDIKKLTEGDDDPMFVTVEVLNPSVSANKRRWTPELLATVAEQINDKVPDGYLGHLKDEDRATAMPEPQTIWVGATIKEIDGKMRLLAKGYVMPYADKLRSYIKKAIAAGKQVAVSVYGEALQTWNKVDKLYDISEFDLESIDWARTGSAGITPAFIPVIAREQTDESNMEVKLSEATLEQLKELRPDLVDALKEELAKPAEPVTPEPAPAPAEPTPAPEATEVHEMRSLLGVEEGKSVIAEMKAREDERATLLDVYMDSKVAEVVTKTALRGVFKKMVVSEMKGTGIKAIDNAVESLLQSDEGKTFIAEMTKPVKVNPVQDNHIVTSERKYTKL